MLVNAREILKNAQQGKYAVAQLNINNLEWAKYILEACEELKTPVILGVSEGAVKYMGGYKVVYNMVVGLIEDLKITIPAVLHLDHAGTVDSCKKAIDAGFTSVMIDSSKYPLVQNINMVKEVISYARLKDVTVEAEVGHIGGIEDDVVADIAYAELDDCLTLVNETGVDLLAPALGSVHGMYKGKAKIDFDRMNIIQEAITIPLVLHGGTGIDNDTITKSIAYGICKINVNTELQVSWAKAVREFLNSDTEAFDPRKVIGSGKEAIKEVVREKVILFGSNNKSW